MGGGPRSLIRTGLTLTSGTFLSSADAAPAANASRQAGQACRRVRLPGCS
jgi:hypothetical protein